MIGASPLLAPTVPEAVLQEGRPALLRVAALKVHFPIRSGFLIQRQTGSVRAVDGVSFDVRAGEALGLVGESGSGKSTVGRAVIGLVEPTSGTIAIDGVPITGADSSGQRDLRRRVQMIFQNPYASLNPRMTIGNTIADPLRVHGVGTERQRRERVAQVLTLVGLDPSVVNRYPHQFSGGQRQRVGIARALVLSPSLVICDEPVSALDVSVQAQVLNLLSDLREALGLSYLFIGHDLAVVRHIADRIAVMYLGKLMEVADRTTIYASPGHPYTRALLSAVHIPDPSLERKRRAEAVGLNGEIPSPATPPPGCRFSSRCQLRTLVDADGRCTSEEPAPRPLAKGQLVACHYPGHQAPATQTRKEADRADR